MANLNVTIVVRTTGPKGRRWVKATGTSDPAGPLDLRWYEGDTQRHQAVAGSFGEAEMAKMRLEKKLRAATPDRERIARRRILITRLAAIAPAIAAHLLSLRFQSK
jgi:hypothetical protein